MYDFFARGVGSRMAYSTTTVASGELTSIRPFTRGDVDEWCAWPQHSDPLFHDYNSPNMSPRERDFWYAEKLSRSDHAMYAIEDFEGNLVGRLFLRLIDRREQSAVLGVDLRSDKLNQGYGTDAMQTFLRYFFCTLDFDLLKLDVAAYNYRAQRVYEKLGFVYTGERWNTYPSVFMPGVWTDPAFTPVRRFFRPGAGTVSVVHHDMELSKRRWEERQGVEG